MNFPPDNSANFEHFNDINTISSEKNSFSRFKSVSDIIYPESETFYESLFFAFLDNVKRTKNSSKYKQFMMNFKLCIKTVKASKETLDKIGFSQQYLNFKEMKKKLKKVLSKIELFLFAEHYQDEKNEILGRKRQKYQKDFIYIMKILISCRKTEKSPEKITKNNKTTDEIDKNVCEFITKDMGINLEIYEENTYISQKLVIINNYPESDTVHLFGTATGNYRILYIDSNSFIEGKKEIENEKKKLEKEKKKLEKEKKILEEDKEKNQEVQEKYIEKKIKEFKKKNLVEFNERIQHLTEIIEQLNEQNKTNLKKLKSEEKKNKLTDLFITFNNELAIFLSAIDQKNNFNPIERLEPIEMAIKQFEERIDKFSSFEFQRTGGNFRRIHSFLNEYKRNKHRCVDCNREIDEKLQIQLQNTKKNEKFFEKNFNLSGIKQENLNFIESFNNKNSQQQPEKQLLFTSSKKEENDPYNCPPKRDPSETNQENFVLLYSESSKNQGNLQDPFNCPVKGSQFDANQDNFVLIHSEAKTERDLHDDDPFNCHLYEKMQNEEISEKPQEIGLKLMMRICPNPLCLSPRIKEDDGNDQVKCPSCNVEYCFFCSAMRSPYLTHGNHYHRQDCRYFQFDQKGNAFFADKFMLECGECKRLGKLCERPDQTIWEFYREKGVLYYLDKRITENSEEWNQYFK